LSCLQRFRDAKIRFREIARLVEGKKEEGEEVKTVASRTAFPNLRWNIFRLGLCCQVSVKLNSSALGFESDAILYLRSGNKCCVWEPTRSFHHEIEPIKKENHILTEEDTKH